MVFAKRTKATWTVHLYIDCPYCDEWQDVFSTWNEQ